MIQIQMVSRWSPPIKRIVAVFVCAVFCVYKIAYAVVAFGSVQMRFFVFLKSTDDHRVGPNVS
jgi:hypothetical protein